MSIECQHARAMRRVWDLQTGQCVHVLAGHTGRLNRVRVAPSAPVAVTVADDFSARVWDWPAGRCLHVLAGHRGWVSDAALAAGGGAGVTASGDELAVVWNLARGTAVNVLAGHAGEVRSVVLTRRGRCVLPTIFLVLQRQMISAFAGRSDCQPEPMRGSAVSMLAWPSRRSALCRANALRQAIWGLVGTLLDRTTLQIPLNWAAAGLR